MVTLLSLAAEGFIDLDAPDYAPNCQIPYISYPGLEYEKQEQAEPLRLNEVSELLTQRGNSELIPFLPRLLARAPLRVDTFDEKGDALAFKIDIRHYRDSKISVVTETGMGPKVRRITEKTLKPLALGQPCITIGHQHSLGIARELGYDTFDDYIDNTYDLQAEPKALLRGALRSLGGYLARYAADPDLRAGLKAVGERNVRWTLDGFQAHYYEKWAKPLLKSLTGADAFPVAGQAG